LKPLAIDLYCGLGGWAEGLISEGWDVVGFDIERHEYGSMKYPGQLVIQDARTLHGSQFKDASLIVGSSPCQRYSYMAMPWQRAKAQAAEIRADLTGKKLLDLNELFDAQFRIQHEACAAVGRHIPMVVENVKGAQPWVGRANWHFGSFYLWGDVPALMPITQKRGSKIPGQNWSNFARTGEVSPHWRMQGLAEGEKIGDQNEYRRSGAPLPRFTNAAERSCLCARECDCQNPEPAQGAALVSNECPIHNLHPAAHPDCPIHPGPKNYNSDEGGGVKMAGASGAAWFDLGPAAHASGSKARKAASAMIAKIPQPLSQHIARVYYPRLPHV